MRLILSLDLRTSPKRAHCWSDLIWSGIWSVASMYIHTSGILLITVYLHLDMHGEMPSRDVNKVIKRLFHLIMVHGMPV